MKSKPHARKRADTRFFVSLELKNKIEKKETAENLCEIFHCQLANALGICGERNGGGKKILVLIDSLTRFCGVFLLCEEKFEGELINLAKFVGNFGT
jgi:hypothetical protein